MAEGAGVVGAGVVAIVLMGVSGSGKTTIGELLAKRLQTEFADADDYHSVENKAKMREGHALDDADRMPWLHTLNGMLRKWVNTEHHGVLACSALKASYRDILGEGTPPGAVAFVWLDGPRDLIAERLAKRHHEYMNSNLLESQLATLEPPAGAIRVENDRTPEVVTDEVLTKLGLPGS